MKGYRRIKNPNKAGYRRAIAAKDRETIEKEMEEAVLTQIKIRLTHAPPGQSEKRRMHLLHHATRFRLLTEGYAERWPLAVEEAKKDAIARAIERAKKMVASGEAAREKMLRSLVEQGVMAGELPPEPQPTPEAVE